MLSRIVVALLIGAVITRVFLHAQWKGLGVWFGRCVDLCLVTLAVIYVVQLAIIALR